MSQDEILIVVNEQDKVLDYLPRSEVHKNKLLHRTISIVTFTSDGKIVLQKRSKNKDTYPGMLGNAIGGHVLQNQNYLEAAKQEALEELNIQTEPELIKRIIIEDPNHRTMTTIYKIIHDGPYEFSKDEIDEIVVYSPEEIKKIWDQISPPGQLILNSLNLI